MIIDLNNVEQYLRLKYKGEPEGIYTIGAEPYICNTGKNGAIQFEITLWSKIIEKYGPWDINDKHTDHIGLWQLNKLKTMKTINEINTDLTEGKLLIAALAILTTSGEGRDKTPDEVLAELSEAADGIFAATEPEIVPDDQEIDKDDSDEFDEVEVPVNETI